MNDNRTPTAPRRRKPRLAIIAGGLPELPEPCFCGSEAAFVDAPTTPGGQIGPFRVTCANCGAEGPEATSYPAAVALWNDLTAPIH